MKEFEERLRKGGDEELIRAAENTGVYSPTYEKAVEALRNADPNVLAAVHELLFSGYCVVTCDAPKEHCIENRDSLIRFSSLVLSILEESGKEGYEFPARAEWLSRILREIIGAKKQEAD